MELYIAEKPSMAKEIAKTIGRLSNTKPVAKNGFIQIGSKLVTWQFGHLLELKQPEQIDEKYKRWAFNSLPIIPACFKKTVKPDCKKQLEIIKTLVNNTKVTCVIHAGDPDREGELLIREVLYYLKNKKPVKRILLNALDFKSISAALKDLKDDSIFDNLYESAEARSEADWLIGMNLSRAYTLKMQTAGYDGVMNIGRVMTPTMCLVVNREVEIKNFKPITHYKLQSKFRHQNGVIEAKLKLPNGSPLLNENGYILNKKDLIDIKDTLDKLSPTEIKIKKYEVMQKTERQHLPYSLSALQIEAGRKFGYSPQDVLNACQTLYEKKLTTYPRSDCDYLPENQIAAAPEILENLSNIHSLYNLLSGIDLNIKSAAWNDKKISAHHAIIPTVVKADLSSLSESLANIYVMIATAYIAQFYPVHKYNQSNILIDAGKYIFSASGKTVIDMGWRKLFSDKEDSVQNLPVCQTDDLLIYIDSTISEQITKPPKRFTTSTLLEAMKNINKFVQDKKLKQLLKTTAGIGTEATRAGIIDKLFLKGFLVLDKKNIYPSKLAVTLNKILPNDIKRPDMTAVWEDQLAQISEGSLSAEKFRKNQAAFITNNINTIKAMNIASLQNKDLPKCPRCGSILKLVTLKNKSKVWICSNIDNCKKSFYTNYANKPLIMKCPKCGNGYLKQRSGIKGKFWACDNYPECKFTLPDANGKPGKSNNNSLNKRGNKNEKQ